MVYGKSDWDRDLFSKANLISMDGKHSSMNESASSPQDTQQQTLILALLSLIAGAFAGLVGACFMKKEGQIFEIDKIKTKRKPK